MAMLGDVFLNVVYSENPRNTVTTTDHPIETGEQIVDHVERQPYVMSISGIVTGPDSGLRLAKLKEYWGKAEQLVYVYRNWVGNAIITDLSTTHDNMIDGGFRFNIDLKSIRIAQSSIIKELDLPVRVQVATIKNKGQQQTKKTTSIASLTPEETNLLKEMGDL